MEAMPYRRYVDMAGPWVPLIRFRAIVTRSPITADAVGEPPAPGPRNISRPALRDSMKIALYAPLTDASGWDSGTIAGWTRTETSSSCSPDLSLIHISEPTRRTPI